MRQIINYQIIIKVVATKECSRPQTTNFKSQKHGLIDLTRYIWKVINYLTELWRTKNVPILLHPQIKAWTIVQAQVLLHLRCITKQHSKRTIRALLLKTWLWLLWIVLPHIQLMLTQLRSLILTGKTLKTHLSPSSLLLRRNLLSCVMIRLESSLHLVLLPLLPLHASTRLQQIIKLLIRQLKYSLFRQQRVHRSIQACFRRRILFPRLSVLILDMIRPTV